MKLYVLKKGRKFGQTFRVAGEVFEAPRKLAKIWKALRFAAVAPDEAVVGTVIGPDGKVTDRPHISLTPQREVLLAPGQTLAAEADVTDDFDSVEPADLTDTADDDTDAGDDDDDAADDTDDSAKGDGDAVGAVDMKALRAQYAEVFGKNPFNGWDAEKLTAMIAEKKKGDA